MKGSSRNETSSYLCQQCGYRSGKWMGFCPQCRNQEALVQTVAVPRRNSGKVEVVSATAGRSTVRDRSAVGIGELDRVLGGGIVPGAAILVGGEPGVGKSTLLLQVADSVAENDGTVLIATAEESVHQVQMRARRVGVASPGVEIASVYDVDDIVAAATERRPRLLIVDSIQAVSSMDVGGSAGGTSQVRESAARLISFAKSSGVPLVLVGHVTKDGSIAGPRTLEHMVDVVLYLEGESEQGLRFLRGIKNRYGSVNEVGVFTMTTEGLVEVPDPSGLMISHRDTDAAGSVLFPTIEGKRPMVVEVQALVVKTEAPQPRRAVTGLPAARVHQLLGVLERHAAMPLRQFEVYVSVMGGIKVTEPAVDLPVALAVASAYADLRLGGTAAWGEVGLTGELRPVGRPTVRSAEVERIHAGPVVSSESHRRLFDAMVAVGFVAPRR
ncbi:MAG: DNA repair protein RadA [Actinomycetia bacterium]|nr:DNA repair protein RadA [Actinomycetes bacterium]